MKTFILFILFSIAVFAQTTTGYLTTGVSIYTYYPGGVADYEWMQITLIDSATSSTADSAVVEIQNGIGGWTKINCKNLQTYTDVLYLVPGKDNNGIPYMIWFSKGPFRIRKIDTEQLTEKIYFSILQMKAK